MRTLTISTDSFDQVNTFNVQINSRKGLQNITGYVGYYKHEDGKEEFFINQASVCLKAVYTDADRAENARLRTEKPVVDGETVLINGRTFKVKVNGNYSDCGTLTEVK